MPCNSTHGHYDVGQIINRWTLMEPPNNSRHKVLCRCHCGTEKRVKFEHITRGTSLSCRSCATSRGLRKHGESPRTGRTRLNRIWNGMISRCNSPNGDYASIYYDRGIAVCDDWRRSFPSFRDWSLANGYAPNKTLDRRDNDKGYNPDNCRWATTKEQGRNKRHLKKIPAFAESKLLVEWSEDPRCPVSFNTLMCRIRKGWPAELAIVTPSGALRRGSLPSPLYSHVDQDTAHLKRALAD